jgi:hypothetical protein
MVPNGDTMWNEYSKYPDVSADTSTVESAPYKEGKCHININEWNMNPPNQYSVEVTMYDNDGNQIGYTPRTPASDAKPYHMASKLEAKLRIIPESNKDYIQFYLPSQAWTTGMTDSKKVQYCTVGDYTRESVSTRLDL